MFEPGTKLRLREPQSTDETPYPYDDVEVVGPSPVQHATSGESPWAGADAFGVIIKPAGEHFGATLDKPYGMLNELYDIVEIPETNAVGQPLQPENVKRGLTPEQQLAQAARPVKPRETAPHLQNNDKTPEQVLREADAQAKRVDIRAQSKPRRTRKESSGE